MSVPSLFAELPGGSTNNFLNKKRVYESPLHSEDFIVHDQYPLDKFNRLGLE